MAHLKTLETSGDEHLRMQWKLNLVKMLYYKGYSRQDIRNLFKFIDWLLMLPKGLEKEFKNELVNFEEEQKMPYVTSIERIGREEGREEGKEEGREEGKEEGREEGREEGALLNKQNILLRLLSQKFGLTNKESELISKQEDPQFLDKALDEVLFAESKEEVLKHLK